MLGEGVGNDPEKVVLAPYIRNEDVSGRWMWMRNEGEVLREAKGVGEEKM